MARKSRKNVGLIGLGIIGSRIAAGLRRAGFHVYVWNRSPRIEPNFLGSPADVAATCDIIQLFVSDGAAVMGVLQAMAGRLTPEHVIICSATIGLEATREACRFVEERGARFLDAPFTGSKGAAAAQQLVYFVGGDEEVLARVEFVLAASSRAIIKVGSVGQGAVLKVATNMMVATAVQGLAEALGVVARAGIDCKRLEEALEHHAVRSALIDMKLPKMLGGDFEPQFSLQHMLKDLRLAVGVARDLALDVPATVATAEFVAAAAARGWGEADLSVVAKLYARETVGETAALPLGPAAAGEATDVAGEQLASTEAVGETGVAAKKPAVAAAGPALPDQGPTIPPKTL